MGMGMSEGPQRQIAGHCGEEIAGGRAREEIEGGERRCGFGSGGRSGFFDGA